MSDTVEKIKERLTVLEVVQSYVKLTRAGKYHKGLSPFTKEKTPSFFVSPDRGLYHCFSTGKGGDMFTFVEEMEGVDFKGALKILAEKAGVPLQNERPEERGEKERLFASLEEATTFFTSSLRARPDVLEYVLSRGLTQETISTWSVGYAPKEWQLLHTALTEKGFTVPELERAGLVKRAETVDSGEVTAESVSPKPYPLNPNPSPAPAVRVYDRFRGRIMFPIRDISARVVGFSGRIFEAKAASGSSPDALGAKASRDDEYKPAKYLNSPETPVFDKSRALYGLDRARDGIRTLGAALLVEGQFDLLMAHQAGYRNTVATSGTSFTEGHSTIIKRYTENLIIAYDGDRAGIAAAGRAAGVALRIGMNVKIAKLPPEKDPADVLLEDKEIFRDAVKGALHVVDFYLAHIADLKYDQRTFRLEVSRIVLPYIALIPHKIDQAHFIKRVADAIAVDESAVRAELKKVNTVEPLRSESGMAQSAKERVFAKAEPFLSRADTLERIITGLALLYAERGDSERSLRAYQALKDAFGRVTDATSEKSSDDTRASLFEADFFLETYPDDASRDGALTDLYDALQKESRREHYRETVATLRIAEVAGDALRTEELMKELSELARTL